MAKEQVKEIKSHSKNEDIFTWHGTDGEGQEHSFLALATFAADITFRRHPTDPNKRLVVFKNPSFLVDLIKVAAKNSQIANQRGDIGEKHRKLDFEK